MSAKTELSAAAGASSPKKSKFICFNCRHSNKFSFEQNSLFRGALENEFLSEESWNKLHELYVHLNKPCKYLSATSTYAECRVAWEKEPGGMNEVIRRLYLCVPCVQIMSLRKGCMMLEKKMHKMNKDLCGFITQVFLFTVAFFAVLFVLLIAVLDTQKLPPSAL